MRCPYCHCRSFRWIEDGEFMCIKCDALVDDSFNDEGISNLAFGGILLGIIFVFLLIGVELGK